MKKYFILITAAFFLPVVTNAAGITDLKSLIATVVDVLNSLIPLLLALAICAFIWGVVKYLYSSDPQKLAEARSYIIYSIIAIAVMVSISGIIYLVKNSLFPDVPNSIIGTSSTGDPSSYMNNSNSSSAYTP
jgi:uncharacterized membrane protein